MALLWEVVFSAAIAEVKAAERKVRKVSLEYILILMYAGNWRIACRID